MENREEFITEGTIATKNVDDYFYFTLNKIKHNLTPIQLLLIESMLKFIEPRPYTDNKGFELRRIRYEGDATVLIDYASGENGYLAGAVEAYEHVINILKDK